MLATRVSGEGPAVVWLHGYTMDSTTWTPLWSQLPGWTHVGVDLPGHGRSGPIAPGTTLADAAAQIADVAREAGAVRMVALSFGTILALQVALDHPDVVENLTLSAPALAGGPAEPGATERYVAMMKLFHSGADRNALVEEWMSSPPDIFTGTQTKPILRFTLRSIILRHAWTELGSPTIATMLRHQHTDDDLSALKARLLVLVGDQEMPVTAALAERMERLVPQVERHSIAGAGHLAPLERPDVCAPLIAAHLSS